MEPAASSLVLVLILIFFRQLRRLAAEGVQRRFEDLLRLLGFQIFLLFSPSASALPQN